MSLIDVLGDAGAVAGYIAGASIIIPCGKELFTKYYIPWTKKLEEELAKEPMEDYRFSDSK